MSDDDDCVLIEDNVNYKSITCDNLPQLFLDKVTAKNHFRYFGKINRFIFNPKRLYCTVEYEDEGDARNAFENAGIFNGLQFDIRYTSSGPTSYVKPNEDWIDPEVQAELDAMGNTRHQLRITGLKPFPKVLKTNLKTKTTNEAAFVDVNLKSELEGIVRKQATDMEEKYRILDARDKLIRLTTVRTTDIKKAVSTKGFCPDMCPEKERLLREAKHQVSFFELEEGNRNFMNHRIAIKEYSRSSADQETPLAHELRPEPVLEMTMNYLMHKIMDLCEYPDTNIGDWYHFVWDRTRSIRKDTTQQELCSAGSVKLVEQCARFHIHCAARLINEDPSVFDQKINTENLTKCLQTLKYMYHDLRLRGIKCPNEGEFRAYIVLLNLNDSNFLWEVKQLPMELQNSREIRFALSVYLSMESNNYFKFFQHVRDTTYMSACILLRYFTQVRIASLKTIIKAYNPPRNLIAISLKYLSDILAFESQDAALAFFEYCSLPCDTEKVYLDKRLFFIPDEPFIMDRSLVIVEAKRTKSVGEVVCGQKLCSLDIYEKHVVHNSFDDNGYLKSSAWTAEDQSGKIDIEKKKLFIDADTNVFKVPLSSPPVSPKQQIKSRSDDKVLPFQLVGPTFTNARINFATDKAQTVYNKNAFPSFEFPKNNITSKNIPKISIFTPSVANVSKIEPEIQTSKSGFFTKVEHKIDTSENILFGLSTGDNNFDIKTVKEPPNIPVNKSLSSLGNSSQNNGTVFVENQIDTKLKVPREDDLETLVFRNKDVNVKTLDEDADKKLWEEAYIKKIKSEEVKKLKELEKKKKAEDENRRTLNKISQIANTFVQELIIEVVKSEINDIIKNEILRYNNVVVKADELTLQILDECIYEQLHEIIDQENKKNESNRRILIESIPSWTTNSNISEIAKNIIHPSQSENMSLMRRYRMGIPNNLNAITPEKNALDLFHICANEFGKSTYFNRRGLLKSKKYMKLIISIPNDREEASGFNAFINSWLRETIIFNNSDISDSFFCSSKDDISLCIRKVHGSIPLNEKKELVKSECHNSDGILFIMTCADPTNSRKRLQNLIQLCQVNKKMPIAIIVYHPKQDCDFIEILGLKKFVEDDKISVYRIDASNKNRNLRTVFQESFRFIVQNLNQQCNLEMQRIPTFLKLTIADEFWKRLKDSWQTNLPFKVACNNPQRVVDLYNAAVDKLIKLSSESIEHYPEFPEELLCFVENMTFDIPVEYEHFPKEWKDKTRCIQILDFLKQLKINPIKISYTNLESIEHSIFKFAKSCINHEKNAHIAAYSSIKSFLEQISNISCENRSLTQQIKFVSWLDVIKPICLELQSVVYNKLREKLPSEIIYKKSTLVEITVVPWWFQHDFVKTVWLSSPNEADREILDQELPRKRKKSMTDSLNIDDILSKSYAIIEKSEKSIKRYRTNQDI